MNAIHFLLCASLSSLSLHATVEVFSNRNALEPTETIHLSAIVIQAPQNRTRTMAKNRYEPESNSTSRSGSSSPSERRRSQHGAVLLSSNITTTSFSRLPVPGSRRFKIVSKSTTFAAASIGSRKPERTSTGCKYAPPSVHGGLSVPPDTYNTRSPYSRKIVSSSVPPFVDARSSTESKTVPSSHPDPIPVRSSPDHVPQSKFTKSLKHTTFAPAPSSIGGRKPERSSTSRKIGSSLGGRGWRVSDHNHRRTTVDAIAMVMAMGQLTHYRSNRVTKPKPANISKVPARNTFPERVLPTVTEPTVGLCNYASYMIVDKHGVMHRTDYKSWLKKKKQIESAAAVNEEVPTTYWPTDFPD